MYLLSPCIGSDLRTVIRRKQTHKISKSTNQKIKNANKKVKIYNLINVHYTRFKESNNSIECGTLSKHPCSTVVNSGLSK